MPAEPLSILLIEDNAGDARLLQEMLKDSGAGFTLVRTDRLAAGLDALNRDPFNVVLLDLSLPDSQGFQTFKQLHDRAPHVPVVVLTGLNDEEVALRAMHEGAQDYLVKGRVDGNSLVRVIRYSIERKLAEQALRQSEDYLRAIVTTAVDAIVTIDAHGTISTFNPAAERMFGYSAAEVADQNVSMLMPQPYRAEHDGYIARYLQTGEAHVIGIGREGVGLRKDGTTFPLDLAVSQSGQPARFTAILRDLTDRRKLEWRLAESQTEARRAIARELHDGMGGHMTGIGLLAQALQAQLARAQSPLAVKAEDLVNSVHDAQKQLRVVVRELMPVEAVPEGLMVALQDLTAQAEKRYGLSCRFECDNPVLLDDPSTARHVFRIVQEAVHNAARHGKPSHIAVSLAPIETQLEITVTDDGSGVKEKPEKPEKHPGIGLDSMRQRARLLGGELSVQPREMGGTVVACRIPWPSKAPSGPAPLSHGRRQSAW